MLTYIKRKKKRAIFIMLAVIAIVIAIKWHHQSGGEQGEAVLVEAASVKESTVPMEARALGTLSARSVEIMSEAAGQVQKVFFKDGSQVKQGTVLLQLDDAVLAAKLASVKADYNYTEGNYNRMLPLGKKGYIAKDTLEKAEAELKKKKAEMQENVVMLQHTKLVAPFDGAIGKCKVSEGEYVTAGQSVVTLTETQHLRVEYNLPEKYLPLLKMGQEVKITSAAYPGRFFVGKVSFISPTINVENRSIALYADVVNEKNELASGMLVDVVQALGTNEHALMIPARSLVPILDGQQVFKIVNGKASAATVVIGKRTENEVQVVQGLSAGDQVITDGQMKVRNTTQVKVKS